MTESTEENQTFEEALKKLETAVESLEEGDLPLDRALQLFEEGLKASDQCRTRLDQARQRVQVLVAESGSDFQLTDLDPDEEAE
jgi:exodeoxyribonuclease VII small subunit